jgi:hypothetical protein
MPHQVIIFQNFQVAVCKYTSTGAGKYAGDKDLRTFRERRSNAIYCQILQYIFGFLQKQFVRGFVTYFVSIVSDSLSWLERLFLTVFCFYNDLKKLRTS